MCGELWSDEKWMRWWRIEDYISSLVLSWSWPELLKRWKTTAKSVNLFDAYLCPIFTLFKFQVIDLRNSSADRSVDYGHGQSFHWCGMHSGWVKGDWRRKHETIEKCIFGYFLYRFLIAMTLAYFRMSSGLECEQCCNELNICVWNSVLKQLKWFQYKRIHMCRVIVVN